VDPVPRIEGHLKLEVTLELVDGVQQVIDASASGTMFRGFEAILQGRPPGDAPHITQRICGVCPVSQGFASVLALESVGGATVPENARLLRNLVLGANYLASHLLHFYQLSLFDFVAGPDRPPWTPYWAADLRITGAPAQTLREHYLAALGLRRKAHEMGALFGGKLPHPPGFVAGGFTATPRAERLPRFQSLLAELTAFIDGTWLPDVETVASAYPEYSTLGAGPQNLLAYGVFDLDSSGTNKLFPRGRIEAGSPTVSPVDLAAVTEAVDHSWYQASAAPLAPAQGETVAQKPKADAYSWLKAPRYQGQAYEVGPLARMWVSGDYDTGISVIDRHRARALEAQKLAAAMPDWLDALDPAAPVYTPYVIPASGQGFGLVEAPRGALGHWVEIADGVLSRYQVITPTCWNGSPRDGAELLGPLEQALVGTPVANADEPVELLRVVHSFDPCLACAVHAVRPEASSSRHRA
jgi:hydrogenase large subunit